MIRARWVALALAMLAVAGAVRFGSFAAGGSDSYCYVEQAERWAAGTITAPVAPSETLPWQKVSLSLAPTGFIPSPIHERAIAPICPPGLALAMAVPRMAGLPRVSVFYVVPVCAGLVAWSVFLVARRMASDWAAVLAVALMVTTPVFVYQGLQPMSDVPAAALWGLSLAAIGRTRGWSFASGLAAGAAILVRPNLAPLAGIIGAYAMITARGSGEGTAVTWRERMGAGGAFAAGALPGVVGVGWANAVLYGSPLSSGYGSLDVLFSWSHVRENLGRYPAWVISTVSPLIVAALAAPWRARDRGYAWMLLVFVAGVWAMYLPYVPFDNWSYLRFMLPGLLPAFALAVTAMAHRGRAARQQRAWIGVAAVLVVVSAWGGWQVSRVKALGVVRLVRDERRFIVTGRFVGDYVAPDALVFTIWQSGSVRYYGSRLTVMWDALEPAELDPAIDALTARSRDTVLVLDGFERDTFRARFAGASRFADLDWPPAARIGSTVSVWRFTDRARFHAGARLDTLQVR